MNSLFFSRVGIACTTALALAACGQNHVGDAGRRVDASADGGPRDAGLPDAGLDAGPPVDARVYAFCLEMSELRCRGTEVCCGLPDRVGFLYWGTGCGMDIEPACAVWASDTALRDGTLGWNEAAAQRLLDLLRTALATCSAIPRPFDLSAVFEGTLAQGQDCTPGLPYYMPSVGRFRCRGDLRCELSGNEDRFAGTCAPRGDEGDSCNYDCRAGLWCDGSFDGEGVFHGRCARGQEPDFDCGRDGWCMTRYCDTPGTVRCIEPEPAQTWCGFIGFGG